MTPISSGRAHRRPRTASRRRSKTALKPLFELLEPRYLLTTDFGDAPLPYPVTLAEDGARHTATGPTLGATRDTEADGSHSAAADADGADEDGVTFGPVAVGQLDATVTVNVQNAPGGARLDAWVDLNSDGSWGGPYERIADSVAVVDGNNTITFDVPSWAQDGETFARFRLSASGGFGFKGLAPEGEVEDHRLTIAAPPSSNGQFGAQQVIGTQASAESVFAADVDGDGDVDAVSGDAATIAWYENDGSGTFTTHTVANTGRIGLSVFAVDVDGDGDTDILAANDGEDADDQIAWYQNDGNQNFTANTISTSADGPRSVYAADLDADGDVDVLSASKDDSKIAWYENDGSQNFTTHVITTTAAPGANDLSAADLDADGDLDVVVASNSGVDNRISWFENDGSQSFTPHSISTAVNGAQSLTVGDVDSDSDLDVLSASENDDGVFWHVNDGSGSFATTEISSGFGDGPHSIFAADLDGDGDPDILTASLFDDRITMFRNANPVFTGSTVSQLTDYATGVFAADLDGDGDLDVLSSSQFDGKIAWYENLGGNKSPTLDALADLTIDEDATTQTVNLAGISAGAGETQPLRVTATSSDTSLIPDPNVTYTSPNAAGTLAYTPVPDASGTATVTVNVEDGGPDGNLSTAADNAVFFRTFQVTVNPVNDLPTLDLIADQSVSPSASVPVNLTGITAGGGETQPLKVTAASSDTSVIPNPVVTYTSPNQTGMLSVMAVAAASGAATITVTVEDGGLDSDLSTTGDNGQLQRTFDVTVNSPSTTVTGLLLNGGSNNRSGIASLTWQFSAATTVDAAGSLILWNHTTGARVDVAAAALVNNGSNAVTWNLSEITVPEGNYTATLPKTAAELSATHSESFHRLPGDSSGDGAIGFGDFGELASNFNRIGGPIYGPGDLDGDGDVGFSDFSILASNFNRALTGLTLDFGDALESGTGFPTTRANNGARHVLGSGLLLGATADAETDGQPDANAAGDGGDEDGVAFATLQAGTNPTITVTAVVPATAVLNAWIDFNRDGDWDDSGEQVFTDQALSTGVNSFDVPIPAEAAAGQAFARFRATSVGGYSYAGLAKDGEVEDYHVTIVAARGSASRGPAAKSLDLLAPTFVAWPGVQQHSPSLPPRQDAAPKSRSVQPASSETVDLAPEQIDSAEPAPASVQLGSRLEHAELIDRLFEEEFDLLVPDDRWS